MLMVWMPRGIATFGELALPNTWSSIIDASGPARVVSDSRILSGSQRKSVARGPLSPAQSKERLTTLACTFDASAHPHLT
jgi:hypothetical protein